MCCKLVFVTRNNPHCTKNRFKAGLQLFKIILSNLKTVNRLMWLKIAQNLFKVIKNNLDMTKNQLEIIKKYIRMMFKNVLKSLKI